MKKKIVSIIGTRPQIFKCDPDLTPIIINTGQHFDDDLAGQHFRAMKIRPKYDLGCTSDELGKMIDKTRLVLQKESPDVVLVYGDTYSTLAGAIAASLEGIPIGHVEAGLRSFDRSMPEETNRIVVDQLSKYRFCPTHQSMRNLIEEGLGDGSFLVGDPLYWSFKYFLPLKKRKDWNTFLYATIHRRENLNKQSLTEILAGLEQTKLPVLLPLHPHTKRILKKLRLSIPKNVRIVKPLGRKQNLENIFNARCTITDSGGIQREAYWMMKRSVIVRPVTEWTEIVDGGWAMLVPANAQKIADAVNQKLTVSTVPEMPKYDPYRRIKDIING